MIKGRISSQTSATSGDNNRRNMCFFSAAVRLAEIYSNSERKCKVQGKKDRCALKVCVTRIREAYFTWLKIPACKWRATWSQSKSNSFRFHTNVHVWPLKRERYNINIGFPPSFLIEGVCGARRSPGGSWIWRACGELLRIFMGCPYQVT